MNAEVAQRQLVMSKTRLRPRRQLPLASFIALFYTRISELPTGLLMPLFLGLRLVRAYGITGSSQVRPVY